MSICDLGQALVMHERFYEHTQAHRAAGRTAVPAQAQSGLLWRLLLLTVSKWLPAHAAALHHSGLEGSAFTAHM